MAVKALLSHCRGSCPTSSFFAQMHITWVIFWVLVLQSVLPPRPGKSDSLHFPHSKTNTDQQRSLLWTGLECGELKDEGWFAHRRMVKGP